MQILEEAGYIIMDTGRRLGGEGFQQQTGGLAPTQWRLQQGPNGLSKCVQTIQTMPGNTGQKALFPLPYQAYAGTLPIQDKGRGAPSA